MCASSHPECMMVLVPFQHGRQAAILRMSFDYKFLHGVLRLSRWGVFFHPVCFLLSTCVVVWDDGITPSLKSLSKNQGDDVLETQ